MAAYPLSASDLVGQCKCEVGVVWSNSARYKVELKTSIFTYTLLHTTQNSCILEML